MIHITVYFNQEQQRQRPQQHYTTNTDTQTLYMKASIWYQFYYSIVKISR